MTTVAVTALKGLFTLPSNDWAYRHAVLSDAESCEEAPRVEKRTNDAE